jgi:hypothetical protein
MNHFIGTKTYQVWHDRGWPQSRIDQKLGGAPPSRFPSDYFHAADVQANSLREAVERTTSKGHLLKGDHEPWSRNAGVQSHTPPPFVPRDTDKGDVIVDPQGRAYRVEKRGFREIAIPREQDRVDGYQADQREAGGKHRIWQAHDQSAAAAGWGAFPGDYRHAIDVQATSLRDAYESTSQGGWWEAMEVEVIASNVRSTAVGDVIVAPNGKAHRIGPEGFKEVDPGMEKAAREEPALERVERQLRDWKIDHSPEFVPDPATGRIGPGTYRPTQDAWASISAAEKLRVLEAELDWNGVVDKAKESVLAREVDFSKMTRDQLNSVYEDTPFERGIDERPARRLFDDANYARAVADAGRAGTFGEQMAKVRHTTRSLVQAIQMDEWPSHAAIVDFGLDSQKHYEALYYPIRNEEIAPAVLDAAMGHGEKLTELARGAPSNPHKEIEFHTSWDTLLGRTKTERPEATRHDERQREDATRSRDPADFARSGKSGRGRDGLER